MITLVHTLIVNEEKTGVSKVLVVCPVSTVLNWKAEFHKWLPNNFDYFEVYELVSIGKTHSERCYTIDHWYKNGGVLIVGYDMFRNLSNDKNKKVPQKTRKTYQKCLVDPGMTN